MRGWVVGGGERKKIASESKDHFDVSHHHWFLFFIDVYATSLLFWQFQTWCLWCHHHAFCVTLPTSTVTYFKSVKILILQSKPKQLSTFYLTMDDTDSMNVLTESIWRVVLRSNAEKLKGGQEGPWENKLTCEAQEEAEQEVKNMQTFTGGGTTNNILWFLHS